MRPSLLRLVEPLEIRLKQRRVSATICLADHGLRASWLQEIVPLDSVGLREQPELTVLTGHIAERVVGATLNTITGLDVAHLPERHGEPEIDFVVTIGRSTDLCAAIGNADAAALDLAGGVVIGHVPAELEEGA